MWCLGFKRWFDFQTADVLVVPKVDLLLEFLQRQSLCLLTANVGQTNFARESDCFGDQLRIEATDATDAFTNLACCTFSEVALGL